MNKTLRLLSFLSILVLLGTEVMAQTFILQPPKLQNNGGGFDLKLLLKQDRNVRLDWQTLAGGSFNLNGTNARLIVGRNSNSYNLLEQNVSGTNFTFTPSAIGLSPGRYYARITNSTARTTSDIRADQQSNASIIFSNEILIIIEADDAPSISAPRGQITNATPTFRWSAVSGVVNYWIIVSSTPFDIVEDADGNISIEGATLVWQYITDQTTAVYGSINNDSPFTDEAPPLNANQEYSYTVLNVYEPNNPVFTSAVFGGIVPFTYVDPNAVPATTLQNPTADQVIYGEETIAFEWSNVPLARGYTINLLQVVKQQGIDVTVPLWSSTTTNTLIEYPALSNLKNGNYFWNVTSNNDNGGGTTTANRKFTYRIPTGAFTLAVRNNSDNSTILGAELNVRAISGGVTPSVPFYVQDATLNDSLVVGVYEFTVSKLGFDDVVVQHEVVADRNRSVTVRMNEKTASINGSVLNQDDEAEQNVQITALNLGTNEEFTGLTDVNGIFNIPLESGSYSLSLSKSGFLTPEPISVTVELGDNLDLSTPFVVTEDEATVSGSVFNEDGGPVQRAVVVITNGSETYEARTTATGAYQFTVSSGNWTLSVSKIGFVKPEDELISLSTGDLLQNQDFFLTGNANQITGFVRERITNDDGSVGSAPFADILVQAIPDVGEAITTRSSTNGQYTLSLKSGSYTIQAVRQNYSSGADQDLVIGIAIGETISGINFELTPNPSSISGTVSLPNGNGVSAATVSIPNIGTVQTNSSGYYQVSVPQGSHRVGVSKSGLVSPSARTISINAGQNLTGVNFEMTPNAGTISGRIVSSGENLSNTTVIAVNAGNGQRVQITNQLNGTYNFNLQSGNWYIKAQKSGFLSDSTSTLTVGPGQQLVNVNLSLVRNQTQISGTVTDGNNPIRNATVRISRSDGSAFDQSTVTQVNGTYAFSVPAGVAYTIVASRDGFRSVSQTTQVLQPGGSVTRGFQLTANPSSVAGTIRLSNGTVLPNVKVVAFTSGGSRVDSTVSRSDGTYLLGLSPGDYTLRASRSGYTTVSKTTTLQIGQNLTGINFTSEENFAFVSGLVTNGAGNPIPQVFVNLTNSAGAGASTVTDASGNFSISRLIGGTYTISFTVSGFVDQTVTRTAADGAFLTLNRNMVPKNGTLAGQVQDENGIVLSDASVTATHSDGTQSVAITNTAGEFILRSLKLGDYTLEASKTGYTTVSTISASVTEETLNVTGLSISDLVPNNAVIQGRVSNSADDTPLQGVQVTATGSRGSGFATTDASGNFRITNLIPSDYQIIGLLDGFRSDSAQVSINPSSPSVVQNLELIQNNGVIVGQLTDPNGAALPFRVNMTAVSSQSTFTTRSNTDGSFTFEGVETGTSYTISTDIFREGYLNTEASVTVPLGAPQTEIPDPIDVPARLATIRGNVGLSGASVQLINAVDDQIIQVISAAVDGSFVFNFLEAGSYRVAVGQQGYIFNPAVSGTLELTFNGTSEFNTTATPNVGSITASILNAAGSGISNVDVTIVSSDTTVVRTRKSASNGSVSFVDVKAGVDYTIRPQLTGFTASPETRVVSLSAGGSASAAFTLSANDASLSGRVRASRSGSLSNLNAANVLAIRAETGQTIQVTSNAQGNYSFGQLAAGNYSVVANKAGYVADTVQVTLTNGQNGQAPELVLESSVIRVSGVVEFKGQRVAGAKVTALSTTSFETTTNTNGVYTFSELPIRPGANDTTVYKITIESDLFSTSYSLELGAADAGTATTLPVTILPSGQILLSVTDGVNPLSGATLSFGLRGGQATQIVTGNDGLFASSDNLRGAEYVVSVEKAGYLFPENTISILLESDTSQVEQEIVLPYRQRVVSQILADQTTNVIVFNEPGYGNSGASGTLYYRQQSQTTFTQVPMSLAGDSLVAAIPALNSVEEVTFYTSITDANANNTFTSNQRSITPLASGLLSSIRLRPSLTGQTLRAGDTYSLNLVIRDGINESLADKFEGTSPEGTLTWEVLQGQTGIEFQNEEGTQIKLITSQAGSYQIRIQAQYLGRTITRTIPIEVSGEPLGSISVNAPGTELDNAATHVFGYAARDITGRNILLGDNLTYRVVPMEAGTISNIGVFTPTDNNTIGSFTIEVFDGLSEITGVSDNVQLTKLVRPTEGYTLYDGLGFEISLSSGSVTLPARLSLAATTPPATKKFVFAEGTDVSYTVGDQIYDIRLSGSTLQNIAFISLPSDSSLTLASGEKVVGRFGFRSLQWTPQSGANSDNPDLGLSQIPVASLGQFAVMAENEPLGIKHAAVLPSPFSPDVAPVKIGYYLDTAFPPAKVTIKIYNIRGELVRTLLDNDIQQPGRYGSSSSQKEISWDGITNDGRMARNGRYVIQIKAKDQEKEVSKVLQVVLIK